MVAVLDLKDHLYGEIIRKYRSFQGMSQTSLARQARISTSSLSNIESGVTSPRATTLVRISEVLGVTTAHLTGQVPFMADWPTPENADATH